MTLQITSTESFFFKNEGKIKTLSYKTKSLSQVELHWSLQDTDYAKTKNKT